MGDRIFRIILWSCLGLFVFRVGAQLVQLISPMPILPPFEAWHSDTLPYSVLLASQTLIIAFMGRVTIRAQQSKLHTERRTAIAWLIFGIIYFGGMLTRLTLGFTLLSGNSWFDSPLPTVFHLVLATFVLVASASCLRSKRSGQVE
jgi:hypothetical protein